MTSSANHCPQQEMNMSSYLESINIFLTRPDVHSSQSRLQVQLVRNFLGRTVDLENVERSGTTRTKGVHADSLANLDTFRSGRDDRGEGTVKRSSVHVTASRDTVLARDNSRLIMVASDTNKSLLNDLVGIGLSLVEGLDVLRDVGESGMRGVSEVVLPKG